MSETVSKNHPLADFMESAGATRVVAPCVEVTIEPFLAHVNIRGNPADSGFREALRSALGQEPPTAGRVSRARHAIYWLGPEEFLTVSRRHDGRELVDRLGDAFTGLHAAATDLSGGQVLLCVSGPAARSFLNKASTLDLHADVFRVNDCAQSTFAKAAALYALRDDQPVFELVIRRSFADYAARWMQNAGQEFGIVFND